MKKIQSQFMIGPKRKLFKTLFLRNIPHKTSSKEQWCLPVWYAWIFGGWYDGGNGYGWSPSMYGRICKYYDEKWWKAGYTLFAWLHYPRYNNIGGDNKKLNCKSHGLW